MELKEYLVVSEEVADAVKKNRPVVALESTIITHGMPYPKNVETALNVERIVRENGAVPATIAIIKGKIVVGAEKEQIEYLGKEGTKIAKASRRDLPVLLAKGKDGASTVATTMIAAKLAGIKVFATGGIGGVHRGAELTMDISADLEELSNTGVCVVCAGCKSILDIGLTLEYLETKGVPVIGYRTKEMPAFFTVRSGFDIDYELESTDDIAAVMKVKQACNLEGGIVVANPIPEEYSMDYEYISGSIEKAVQEAKDKGVKGKNITPFLLERIEQLTEGKSLEANIHLVYHNAALGAAIAAGYCKA